MTLQQIYDHLSMLTSELFDLTESKVTVKRDEIDQAIDQAGLVLDYLKELEAALENAEFLGTDTEER